MGDRDDKVEVGSGRTAEAGIAVACGVAIV
jgi:hypothetical protein